MSGYFVHPTISKLCPTKLPDSRNIRCLPSACTQERVFTLRSSGLYVPANESIMLVKDHDLSLQSGEYEKINLTGWWRAREYACYPKGFEKRDLPLGAKIVYVEGSYTYTLEIPDVRVKLANGNIVGLRDAVGMGVFRLEKLNLRQIDNKSFLVSVTDDFRPETDIKVVDFMRPDNWALVDENGFPLRSLPSDESNPKARCSFIKHEYQFEPESTGYHGSMSRIDNVYGIGDKRDVAACVDWHMFSAVAVISLDADERSVAIGKIRQETATASPKPEAYQIAPVKETFVMEMEDGKTLERMVERFKKNIPDFDRVWGDRMFLSELSNYYDGIQFTGSRYTDPLSSTLLLKVIIGGRRSDSEALIRRIGIIAPLNVYSDHNPARKIASRHYHFVLDDIGLYSDDEGLRDLARTTNEDIFKREAILNGDKIAPQLEAVMKCNTLRLIREWMNDPRWCWNEEGTRTLA